MRVFEIWQYSLRIWVLPVGKYGTLKVTCITCVLWVCVCVFVDFLFLVSLSEAVCVACPCRRSSQLLPQQLQCPRATAELRPGARHCALRGVAALQQCRRGQRHAGTDRSVCCGSHLIVLLLSACWFPASKSLVYLMLNSGQTPLVRNQSLLSEGVDELCYSVLSV